MEATFSSCKISHSFALLKPQVGNSPLTAEFSQIRKKLEGCTQMKLWRNGQRRCGLVICCDKSGGGSLGDMDAKINSEKKLDFVVERNCEGKRGIVELMECLESEAIMGENEGKEASDYNRRAQIFDKSAQVFQALKEETTSKEETKECPTDA